MAEIVSTPGVVGGRHRIDGTRIMVIDVVERYQELGWSIEKISRELDITPVQVTEALKFYYQNPKMIRQELRDERASVPM